MKPYVGQMVEYRYKPDASTPPVAAVVARLHEFNPGWVSLYCFTENPRWLPSVEFAIHCRKAQPVAPTYQLPDFEDGS